jgi:lincosamide nucleotidyltransferase A/C/D/E
MPVEVEDVLEILHALRAARVEAVVQGGWGVDALLSEQTRPHDDLDLWTRVDDDVAVRRVLASLGFVEEDGGAWQNYVLRDPRGRKVDLHLIRFRPDGGAVYEMEDGGRYELPPDAFTTGSIGGLEVRCVSAEQQMMDHATGYEPDDGDRADMRALHGRLGVAYLPPFG